MSIIIDSHSHFMPPEVAENTASFKFGWSDVDKQLALMDDNGIEKSLLIYPTSDAHINMGGWTKLAEVYNQKINDLVSKHSDRFLGACIIPFNDPKGRDEVLKNYQDNAFKAFSLASSYDGVYLDDEYFEPVFEYAQSQKIPVHIHSQIINPIGAERVQDPLLSPVLEYVFDVSMCLGKMMMEGTLLKYPDVDFVFAHYGGVLPILKERFDTTYTMLRSREFVKDLTKVPSDYFKNLYFDTSGSKSKASLACALEVTDASHILFGSDYPANKNLQPSIDVIEEVGLAQEDVRNIQSANMLRLFN